MARISIAGMAAFLIPLGVLEILVYCRFVGIPVPVDVYSVAGTAIILAVFSLFAFVLVAVCACMPAFLLMWFVRPKTYHNIAASCLFGMSFGWARKGDPVESMRRVTQFKFLVNYVLLSIIPLMVFYLAYWSESMIVFVVWMAFAMLAPLIFGLSFFKYSVAVPRKSYMDRLFFYGIAYVYQIYYYFMLWQMLKLFPAVWGSESFMLHAIVVVGFVVVNGLCMLPLRPDNEFEVVALRHKSSNFIKDFLSVYNPNVIFMVAAIGFFMMIIPQTNYGVVKASLKFMAIGGNVERRYYFSEQDFNSVPDVLVDLTPPELLRIPNAKITKNVYVVLDVGNSLIVSLSDNDGERIVYALPKDKMRYLLEVKPLSAK